MPIPFPDFETSDLAHANTFNTKVKDPGEALRLHTEEHTDDVLNNPHSVTWDQTGAASNTHGNEHHDPDFLTAADITGFITDTQIHGNEKHNPDMALADHDHTGTYAPTPHRDDHHSVACERADDDSELRLEVRAGSDPTAPAVGRIWLRSDL